MNFIQKIIISPDLESYIQYIEESIYSGCGMFRSENDTCLLLLAHSDPDSINPCFHDSLQTQYTNILYDVESGGGVIGLFAYALFISIFSIEMEDHHKSKLIHWIEEGFSEIQAKIPDASLEQIISGIENA